MYEQTYITIDIYMNYRMSLYILSTCITRFGQKDYNARLCRALFYFDRHLSATLMQYYIYYSTYNTHFLSENYRVLTVETYMLLKCWIRSYDIALVEYQKTSYECYCSPEATLFNDN
jgi:hypothetical protein